MTLLTRALECNQQVWCPLSQRSHDSVQQGDMSLYPTEADLGRGVQPNQSTGKSTGENNLHRGP